jgi:hypothetical protein
MSTSSTERDHESMVLDDNSTPAAEPKAQEYLPYSKDVPELDKAKHENLFKNKAFLPFELDDTLWNSRNISEGAMNEVYEYLLVSPHYNMRDKLPDLDELKAVYGRILKERMVDPPINKMTAHQHRLARFSALPKATGYATDMVKLH